MGTPWAGSTAAIWQFGLMCLERPKATGRSEAAVGTAEKVSVARPIVVVNILSMPPLLGEGALALVGYAILQQ